MALPDILLRTNQPGVYDFKVFVGGGGQSWMRDLQFKYDTPKVVLPLTGITCTAEVRSLDDLTVLATITVAVTDSPNGKVRLTMTKAVCDAIAWPPFGSPIGQAVERARWHCDLDDGAGHVVMLRGAVEVIR